MTTYAEESRNQTLRARGIEDDATQAALTIAEERREQAEDLLRTAKAECQSIREAAVIELEKARTEGGKILNESAKRARAREQEAEAAFRELAKREASLRERETTLGAQMRQFDARQQKVRDAITLATNAGQDFLRAETG